MLVHCVLSSDKARQMDKPIDTTFLGSVVGFIDITN